MLSATVAVIAFNVSPAQADVDSVSGSATALSISGLGTLSPTVSGSASEALGQDGYGPVGSGLLQSGVVCPGVGAGPALPLPVLLSVGVLEACTQGGDVLGEDHLGFAESRASAAEVVLGTLNLGVIRSSCRADGNGAAGSTQIIGTSGFPANPTVNQPGPILPGLPLGILSLTLNKQTVVNTQGTATITVDAINLTLLGIEIVIGRTQCSATGPNVNVPTTITPPTTATPTTLTPTTVTPTTAAPATTTTNPNVIIVTQTSVASQNLARTGSDGYLAIAWAAMALTLGSLLVMGAQGLPATARVPGRWHRRREAFREVFQEMRRFK